MPAPEVKSLGKKLGYRFESSALLEEALTHPSFEEGRTTSDYNRLEFLGDRVLGVVVSHWLYERMPAAGAGDLAQSYNALVRKETLARVAEALGIGPYIRMAGGEAASGGREKPAILADSMEAVIGAIYLDGGLDPASRFIRRHWKQEMTALGGEGPKDAKSALQEWAHRHEEDPPSYEVMEREGPPHEPVFTVRVSLGRHGSRIARGTSKRVAEQAAARAMLTHLGHD